MIHPTAIIEPGANISDNVEIGAYSIVGKNVSIGIGTRVGSHSLITGKTSIGKNNNIFHHVLCTKIDSVLVSFSFLNYLLIYLVYLQTLFWIIGIYFHS